MIHCRLKAILDQRGESIRKVSEAIEYRFESVRKLYNNTAPFYHRDLLDKLCTYLGVEIGELLEVVKEEI
ncbi:MAG: helix-turn-helix transcriptional regulator [Paenibacillaceae bacterium]